MNAYRDGNKCRYQFYDKKGIKLKLQIITTKIIPGKFIKQKCSVKNCNKTLIYWSLTSQPKPEYRGAKCERHGGKLG